MIQIKVAIRTLLEAIVRAIERMWFCTMLAGDTGHMHIDELEHSKSVFLCCLFSTRVQIMFESCFETMRSYVDSD